MSSFFSPSYRKELRHNIVHSSFKYLKKCCPRTNIAEFVVKAIHFMIVLYLLFSVFFASTNMLLFNIAIASMILICFFYFNGCLISMVEYKLCETKDQFINIVDPFILLTNGELSNINRYYYSLYGLLLYLLCCLLLVFSFHK